MHRRQLAVVAVAVLAALALSGCFEADESTPGEDVGVAGTPTTGATLTTSTVATAPTSTVAPTTTATFTSTTAPAPGRQPGYLVYGDHGVARITGGDVETVWDTPVAWAADDGSGGVVVYEEPGTILQVGAGGESSTLATDASPRFVTLRDGRPVLMISQIGDPACGADEQSSVLIDLVTADRSTVAPCVPLEAVGGHPTSTGASLALHVMSTFDIEVIGDMWLEFRELATGEPTAVPANPWPDPCQACALGGRLSPDGTLLAVTGFTPAPADLGAESWDAFRAMDPTAGWQAWENARAMGWTRISVIRLDDGTALWEHEAGGPCSVLGFDGRYLAWRFEGMGNHGTWPYNTHLVDTTTGEELEIRWADQPRWSEQQIALLLPT